MGESLTLWLLPDTSLEKIEEGEVAALELHGETVVVLIFEIDIIITS